MKILLNILQLHNATRMSGSEHYESYGVYEALRMIMFL